MALSPEWQLLLAGAKTHLTPPELHRIAQHLMRSRIDWPRLAERAYHHGVAPLLYDNLQQADAAGMLPHEALKVLQRAYHAMAVRNAVLYDALRQVLQALAAATIPVIVLKGAALAETVYPRRALRPMSDIDLLIQAADLSRAEERLLDLGYALKAQRQPKAWQRTHHYHFAFVKPDNPTIHPAVEIHWHIEPPRRAVQIDLDGLWDRAVAVTLADVDTRMLAPEDLLLHLCLHTCRHAGSPMGGGMVNFRLRSFCDLTEVIRHYGPTIEWGELVRRAQHWRIQGYVYLPLRLAQELLGAAVPAPVLHALEPEGFDARLIGWARAELLEEPGGYPLFPDLLRLWQGRLLKDRAAVVTKILSPSTVARTYGLPPGSRRVYGCYPARLGHLLRRYGPVLWRLLRHDQQVRAMVDGKSQLAAWLAAGWREDPSRPTQAQAPTLLHPDRTHHEKEDL